MEEREQRFTGDRYSLNLAAESISTVLSFLGGIVSTAILWRAIAWGSWTTQDYGVVKVLTNAGLLLFPFIILGINSSVVRVVAEYACDRSKLAQAITGSLVIVLASSLTVIVCALLFRIDLFLLEQKTVGVLSPTQLFLFWVITLVTLLPSALLRLIQGAFQGLQIIKRTVIVDIVYNTVRILALIFLALTLQVTIANILVLNLGLGLIAAGSAIGLLLRETKRNSVLLYRRPGREVTGKLLKLASVFFVASIAGSGLTNLTVLWVNTYGSLVDVGHYTIAQGIVVTATAVLHSPLIAMTPNLTVEYTKGQRDVLVRKFREGYRMLVPTLGFSFAMLFAFAHQILRIVFNETGVQTTTFLQLLSFSIFLIVTAVYSYLYVALNDTRGLLYASLQQIAVQVIWVVTMAPLIGVNAVAMIWLSYLPYFFIQHRYSKRKHAISMDLHIVGKDIVVALFFAALMWVTVSIAQQLVSILPVFPVLQAALVGLLAIPFWYLFILVTVHLRLIDSTDMGNMERVLRIVPPVWWVSRPMVRHIRLLSERQQEGSV
ncbi:MAG: hypothetical protein C4K49_00865 [Candidatus Thorarchaeota archaeon]|nr:MAG: hypothetical protein C4K49_00865 [Candidatus Thorarchaeota archaeon]